MDLLCLIIFIKNSGSGTGPFCRPFSAVYPLKETAPAGQMAKQWPHWIQLDILDWIRTAFSCFSSIILAGHVRTQAPQPLHTARLKDGMVFVFTWVSPGFIRAADEAFSRFSAKTDADCFLFGTFGFLCRQIKLRIAVRKRNIPVSSLGQTGSLLLNNNEYSMRGAVFKSFIGDGWIASIALANRIFAGILYL